MNRDLGSSAGVQRTLLVSAGPLAHRMAERAAVLSAEWLRSGPPLVALDLAIADTDAVQTALDALASAERREGLRRVELQVARASEVFVWLVIDLLSPEAPAPVPAVTFVREAGDMAWRRLRADLHVYALLLAEPANAAILTTWCSALADAGIERLLLAGPVNYGRDRLPTEAWLSDACVALTGLFWAASLPARTGPDGDPLAIGGAAWHGDVAELRAAVADWLARVALQRLTQPANPAEAANGPGAGPMWISPRVDAADLAVAVPPPPPAGLWRGRQPSLTALRQLPDRLAADAQRRHTTYRQSVYTVREAWLSARVAAGEAQLVGEVACRMAPRTGWPQVAACVELTRRRKGAVHSALVQIEDDLEAAAQARTAAEVACEKAAHDLTALIDHLPQAGWRQALGALARPWHWLGWAWGYLFELPRCVQRLLDHQAACEEASWREANVHLLRQAYLALAQVAGEAAAEAELAAQLLMAAAETLAQESPAPLPEPWAARRLEAVAAGLLPERGPSLANWLDELQAEDGADVLARVRGWAAAIAADLAPTSAEQLAAALDGGEITAFLDALREQAQPLWPAERQPGGGDSAKEGATLDWLIWRPGSRDETESLRLPDAARPLQGWCEERGMAGVLTSAADAVAVMRMVPVAFNDFAAMEGARLRLEMAVVADVGIAPAPAADAVDDTAAERRTDGHAGMGEQLAE